ncbi:hypothetical protein BDV93DRAFT_436452 [Ceratobasidium sp. AG-I]|nr:hypothetical protein BDV93DRAFT_436452 [Ceratobasidium sp. AG-I]
MGHGGGETSDSNPPMMHIDRESLYTSLPDRVSYLTSFLEFTESDADTLNEAALILEPYIATLVDRVYAHLFQFSVTKEVFLPRATGHEGPMVADLSHLTLEDEQIKERKRFFSGYIKKLITSDYNDFKTWEYYDKVGLMHTGEAGLKHRKIAGKDGLRVDHIHLSGLLGWTMDQIIVIILRHEELDLMKKETIVRSLHKVMWIQQDLFSRHYVRDGDEFRKGPRPLAGSRIRTRGHGTSTTSSDVSASCPTVPETPPGRPRRQSGASLAPSSVTSATGTDSVAWNPQPGGTYAPGQVYDTWGKGIVNNPSAPDANMNRVASNGWTAEAKMKGKARSTSKLDEIHSQTSNGRAGLWRRIFGGA